MQSRHWDPQQALLAMIFRLGPIARVGCGEGPLYGARILDGAILLRSGMEGRTWVWYVRSARHRACTRVDGGCE